MLARIGRQNCRLSAIIEQSGSRGQGSRAGRMILEELEKERTRIARDLHAGAGQPLAGIKMNLEMIDGYLAGLPESARDAVNRLRTLADQALAQVRAVSHRLHPPAWQELSTGQALRALVDSAGFSTRMEAKIDIEPLSEEPDHSVKVALYRCAQECLSNIARHANATRLDLRLHSVDGTLELMVWDNGRGLGDGQPKGSGIGLVAIGEHAEALGGTFHISSGHDGTTVTVRIPASGE
jgi:two-component system NarL family sensor kinase